MTKKDFELIAYCIFTANISAINELGDFEGKREKYARSQMAHWFAENLAKTNPKFDAPRFIRACGVEN